VVLPRDAAVIRPVEEPMLAMAGAELLHVPSPVALVSVVELPLQIANGPEIAAGTTPTVTAATMMQPAPGCVYVIFTFPGATPVTSPVDRSTVASEVLLLDHVPLAGVAFNVITPPAEHTELKPVIGSGAALTVTSAVT